MAKIEINDKEIVKIKYYRRKHSNFAAKYGYGVKGFEYSLDDEYYIHPNLRVEISKEEYEGCLDNVINLMEPYPEVMRFLYQDLTDTQGTPISLGDWVRVECGTLTFDVKVHFNHNFRLVPFDTHGWHKVVKLKEVPSPDIAWDTSILRRNREAEPWPSDMEEQWRVLDLKKKYALMQRRVFDYYHIEYNPFHYPKITS